MSFDEQIIGSLRNHDGDAEDNVEYKMNLYFTYESRDTPKSFTLFITVKTISKLNAKHSDKYEIKNLKFSRRGPRSPDNAEFGHFTL